MLQAGGLCSPEREAVAYGAAAHNSFAVQFSRPDLGGTGPIARGRKFPRASLLDEFCTSGDVALVNGIHRRPNHSGGI